MFGTLELLYTRLAGKAILTLGPPRASVIAVTFRSLWLIYVRWSRDRIMTDHFYSWIICSMNTSCTYIILSNPLRKCVNSPFSSKNDMYLKTNITLNVRSFYKYQDKSLTLWILFPRFEWMDASLSSSVTLACQVFRNSSGTG